MRFEFASAGRIVFGAGTRVQVAEAARHLGGRPLLVTGRDPSRVDWLLGELKPISLIAVDAEPTIELIRASAAQARREEIDVIVAVGGGSAIDAAKGIAAMAANPGDVLDYLEVIGKGQALVNQALPVVAVPTTAGTGAEVTRNSVLASHEKHVKASLRHVSMIPRVAVLDPELTAGLPPAITAYTGLDAITQLIEPYVSRRANPVTDGICLEGLRLASDALPRAFHESNDLEARTAMSAASLLGGMALANAGLGVVHGFAAPIGGMFPNAPHGAICAAVLPHGIRANIDALERRDSSNDAIARYQRLAHIVTGDRNAWPEALADWARDLGEILGIPPLSKYGVQSSDLETIAAMAEQASSMKANPILLTRQELLGVLESAL